MTNKSEADFDRAVEAFLDLLARAIARAHLRQSTEQNHQNGNNVKGEHSKVDTTDVKDP